MHRCLIGLRRGAWAVTVRIRTLCFSQHVSFLQQTLPDLGWPLPLTPPEGSCLAWCLLDIRSLSVFRDKCICVHIYIYICFYILLCYVLFNVCRHIHTCICTLWRFYLGQLCGLYGVLSRPKVGLLSGPRSSHLIFISGFSQFFIHSFIGFSAKWVSPRIPEGHPSCSVLLVLLFVLLFVLFLSLSPLAP